MISFVVLLTAFRFGQWRNIGWFLNKNQPTNQKESMWFSCMIASLEAKILFLHGVTTGKKELQWSKLTVLTASCSVFPGTQMNACFPHVSV